MKRLILITLLAFIGNVTFAQSTDYAGVLKAARTLANATPDTALVTITRGRSAITFKYDITKNSGTVAGTIVLQGRVTSADAWTQINSYTLTDATATNSVLLTSNPYVYYRVITTPSGTQNSTHTKYVLYRE